MRWTVLDTPIGELSVATDGAEVCQVRFGGPDAGPGEADPATGDRADPGAVAQLRAYFRGERTAFDLALSVRRGSEFDRAVWAELSRIPFGEMRTYGEVAAAVGEPGAAQAVGVACGRNPIPVIVPCHRVVGAGGKLVGFGGGLHRKRWLLEHEARVSLAHLWD